jgi:3-hydroxyisobutyrate dehydrogenase
MARRLLLNGFPLTVFNRTVERARPFADEGARVAKSPDEAASDAEVIITMVSDDNAARNVWLGENGALAAATPGAVCIECSTVSVEWVRELAAAAIAKNCEFLDAPVTGSKLQAAAGELNFLVGGDPATLDKVRAVLSAMSKSIVSLGPIGSGALLKLINNFICGVQVAALAEGIAMIERSELDRDKAVDVLANGAPGSPLVKALSTRMTTPDYTPNFRLSLMAKDLAYSIHEGERMSLELATAHAALKSFQGAIVSGHGDKDIAAVVEPFRNSAGQALPGRP